MDKTRELLFNISKICASQQAKDLECKAHGDFFNVFNIMHLEFDEVRLHSAILAELLNCRGTHGAGDAFLKAFLTSINLPKDYLPKGNVFVELPIGKKTETSGGRIDIIIENGQHAVIIENKIYASDQDKQLKRYNGYALKKYGTGNYIIVYLTLDGHEADESSAGKGLDYIRLSYSHDIIEWLTSCAQIVYDKPFVRETISQYIQTLRKLTNQDMDKENIEKIADLAIDNLESVVALHEAIGEVGNRLRQKHIFTPLKEFAKKHSPDIYIDDEYSGSCHIWFKKETWNHKISTTSDGGRFWTSLYIGICCENQASGKKTKLDCLNRQPTDWWPYGWEHLPCRDWYSVPSYPKIQNGEVVNWIMGKVLDILKEVEERKIEL